MYLEENDNVEIEERDPSATLEGDRIIQEAIINAGYEVDESFLSEVNIVKLDKISKRNRAISQATKIVAKEVNDPMYAKLKKLNAARMKLKKQIEAKYQQKARTRVKQMMSGMGVKANDLPKNNKK